MNRIIVDIYKIMYNNNIENDTYIGTFEKIKQISENFHQGTFIGKNINDGKLYLVISTEINCYYDGKMIREYRYETMPLSEISINEPTIKKSNKNKLTVKLCGNIKHFYDEFVVIESILSSQGYVVLTPIYDGFDEFEYNSEINKNRIRKSDMLFVINKNGYIDDSTLEEIKFAQSISVNIEYYEPIHCREIVTLIGSSKYINIFKDVENILTLRGYIVNTPAIFNDPRFHNDINSISYDEHVIYDSIHKHKMLMSKCVVVIDKDQYIGKDTQEEIDYCKLRGIPVKSYLEVLKDE